MAIGSLVCAIAAWVMCGPMTALPGMIIGKMEMNAIDRGESPAEGRTLAVIGFWLSLVNLVLYGLLICVYAFFILALVGVEASR